MSTDKKKTSMKTIGVKNPAIITDGCNPELVKGAVFDGLFQIPVIRAPEQIAVPKAMCPFSMRDKVVENQFALCFYENDIEFSDIIRDPDPYIKKLKKFQAVISPDASLFWDAPFAAQVINKYRNHAIAHYLQKKGVYVIPNVRWGDERTYTTEVFPEPLAFMGFEKHSIVSIGSYGLVKTVEEKKHFKAGLEAMLKYLEPEVVLVYGSMPEDIFTSHIRFLTQFYQYPDWTTYMKKLRKEIVSED